MLYKQVDTATANRGMMRPLGCRRVLLALLMQGMAAAFVLLPPAGRRPSVLPLPHSLPRHPASAGAQWRRALRRSGVTATAPRSASSAAAARRTAAQLVATCGVVAALFFYSSPAVAKGHGGGGHGGGGHGRSSRRISEALRWEQVGSVEVCASSPWWEWPRPPPSCSQRPAHGQEITNENLAWKLQQQLEFTKEEWELLKVPTLSADSYIKVGDQYFKPAETPMSAAEQALWASLFLGMFVALALLPPSVSAPSSAKHSQRLEDERRLRLEDERRLWPSAPPHGSAGAQRTGTYSAQYTERGSEFNSTYVLHFDADGRVTGKGSDPDGVLRFPDVLCVCACARACVVPLCVCVSVCLSVCLSVCRLSFCLSPCAHVRVHVHTLAPIQSLSGDISPNEPSDATPLFCTCPPPPFPRELRDRWRRVRCLDGTSGMGRVDQVQVSKRPLQ